MSNHYHHAAADVLAADAKFARLVKAAIRESEINRHADHQCLERYYDALHAVDAALYAAADAAGTEHDNGELAELMLSDLADYRDWR